MKKKQAKDVYTLADLKNRQDADPPIRLGIMGDPVAHSLSPQMQNAALKHCKLDMQYAGFHISPGELREALQLIRELDFVGVNLTVPHKIAALDFVDELDSEAKQIGAVNTVKIENGKSIGFNTDGVGFTRAIRGEFSVDLRDLRVMLLGAGGAARAIAMQCAQANCERLVIVNRTIEKAKQLVRELQPRLSGPRVLGPVARLEAVPWDERALRFQLEHVDLVVNATTLGLKPNDPAPLSRELLAPHHMIYDTVYTRGRTPLLIAADEVGARGVNGLSMLLHQGARSFEIWFGREAPLDVMRAAL
ncbi:MAG: shikimate dehydrogenase [Verrucomicrobiota bacterium]